MELDERKVTILKAIIQTYMETGEPVGSRTISKYTDLNLSSATIRNEMSDLEEMGYIIQPHTSAGRIPSDKGYRFYVDQILQEKEQEVSEIKDLVVERMDRVESVLKRMAESLAVNTNYAAMISAPQTHQNKLKFIQLSEMEPLKLLVVIVLEGNLIKNQIIEVQEPLTKDEVLNLNILLNSSLNGLTIEEINLSVITQMKEAAGKRRDVVDLVLNEVAKAIRENEELEIYTSGATNIFRYPELSDSDNASRLINTFEQKNELQEWITELSDQDSDTDIQVYIGNETQMQAMKDCSVVVANYELGEGVRGTIGIVGPKRMDYEKVLGTLRQLMKQLDQTFKSDG